MVAPREHRGRLVILEVAPDQMKIVVSLKQVPGRDSALRVHPDGRRVDESDLSFEMNEPDAYALEEALELKGKLGGEVLAISAGPDRVQSTLREALAKGADRAIHVKFSDDVALDALGAATVLADALRTEQPDLVLTGLQSDDLGFGQTGVIIAELLGFPHASIVVQIEPDGSSVRVKRELEDGYYQNVTLPLPALLTVQSGIRKLRYATLMGIKRAKTKEIKTVEVADRASGPQPSSVIERVYVPSRLKANEILTGNPVDVAAALVEKLRFEARVL